MARGEEPVIGIDLGTMFSCVGVFQDNHVKIVASEHGGRKMPSCVAFTATERLIGDAVCDQAGTNAANTVFNAKRLIGRKFSDFDDKLSSKLAVANKKKVEDAIEMEHVWSNGNQFVKVENLVEIITELKGLGIS
ncbi:hypothetical protein POM88_024811 [Heracleum sosnowskyi]|uniref:Heat shock protein 70 n=1 Tax=Heracleum sosnowskyi TaxID=360622 RepID=A0AAD8I2S7_9APIA|nr:hypothetical protein POM88_024811 [Heracleum sosnowskyi]